MGRDITIEQFEAEAHVLGGEIALLKAQLSTKKRTGMPFAECALQEQKVLNMEQCLRCIRERISEARELRGGSTVQIPLPAPMPRRRITDRLGGVNGGSN